MLLEENPESSDIVGEGKLIKTVDCRLFLSFMTIPHWFTTLVAEHVEVVKVVSPSEK
jgi:hypothetical protein